MAGLIYYQNEKYNYTLGSTKEGNIDYLVLQRTENGTTTQLAKEPIALNGPIQLQVEANHNQ